MGRSAKPLHLFWAAVVAADSIAVVVPCIKPVVVKKRVCPEEVNVALEILSMINDGEDIEESIVLESTKIIDTFLRQRAAQRGL